MTNATTSSDSRRETRSQVDKKKMEKKPDQKTQNPGVPPIGKRNDANQNLNQSNTNNQTDKKSNTPQPLRKLQSSTIFNDPIKGLQYHLKQSKNDDIINDDDHDEANLFNTFQNTDGLNAFQGFNHQLSKKNQRTLN